MSGPAVILLAIAAMIAGAFGWRAWQAHRRTSGLVIGPWIGSEQRSRGYPLHLARKGRGWCIRLDPGKELRAVQDFAFAIPEGAKALRWHYRANIGHVIAPERPDFPPVVSLVLQRKGDDWSGVGDKQFYRLYSPPSQLETGEHIREVPLAGWTGVYGTPGDIGAVIADLSNVSVAFGHAGGRMHGISGQGAFEQLALEVVG